MNCPQSKVEFHGWDTANFRAGQRQAGAVSRQITSFGIPIGGTARRERRSALIDHGARGGGGLWRQRRKAERLADRIDHRISSLGEVRGPSSCSRADGHRKLAVEETMGHVETERAVGLELFLREELIARRFMREGVVASGKVADVAVLVAGERGFDVDEI